MRRSCPATLAPELLQDLLRGELGFNGVLVSDASAMVGLTSALPRRELVPAVIAAGCDMFLFIRNADEDFALHARRRAHRRDHARRVCRRRSSGSSG